MSNDHALRPRTLADYVGQPDVVRQLGIRIRGAKKRDEPLPHALLHGPPGLGKTTLAHVIANEMGAKVHVIMSTSMGRVQDLTDVLVKLGRNDVLFIDELHRLPDIVGESMYGAMEDFKTELVFRGERTKSLYVVPYDLPPFTLIGATTQPGLIEQPLRDRFGMTLTLKYYDVPTLMRIVSDNATKLSLSITTEALKLIGERSRGTPRVAIQLLRFARDVVDACGGETLSESLVAESLTMQGIDELGLSQQDRRYLTVLKTTFNGGPAGAAALAASLGVDADTVADMIEPYLLQQGLIARTPRGRIVTDTGQAHLAKVGAAPGIL